MFTGRSPNDQRQWEKKVGKGRKAAKLIGRTTQSNETAVWAKLNCFLIEAHAGSKTLRIFGIGYFEDDNITSLNPVLGIRRDSKVVSYA